MRNLTTAVLIACTAAMATPALAASADSATIVYGDLDLDSPRGVATFQGRLRAAADRLCGRIVTEPLQQTAAVRECRASVAQEASEKVFGRKGSVTVVPAM